MDYTQYNQEMTSITRNLIEKAKRIKLLILDVDGVMTDGGIIVSEDGTESKRFYAQDGHGLVILKSLDIELGIISGRSSKAVEHRANELGLPAIVGAGELLYGKWSSSRRIFVDCANKKVEILS